LADPFVLRAEGIGRSFGRLEALKSASLWAEAGCVTTIMGRNGSGKTTLMRIAAGWLRPDYGTVSLHGTIRERPTLAEWAHLGLMYVPQSQLVMSGFSVRQHFSAVGRAFGTDHVASAISRTRLEPFLDQPARTLSGGERVRLSLGLILARAPSVLLVDEPLVGLAPNDQEAFGEMLAEMARGGCAVVTSGHDARVLLSISDRIIWSVAGTTHLIGSAADAKANEQFRREYLGPGWADA